MHALNAGVRQVTCVQQQVYRRRIPGLCVRTRALLPRSDFVRGGSFLNFIATTPPLMTLRRSSWPVAMAPSPLSGRTVFWSFRRSLTNTLPRDEAAMSWRPGARSAFFGVNLFCGAGCTGFQSLTAVSSEPNGAQPTAASALQLRFKVSMSSVIDSIRSCKPWRALVDRLSVVP